jgi:hypothetical protein
LIAVLVFPPTAFDAEKKERDLDPSPSTSCLLIGYAVRVLANALAFLTAKTTLYSLQRGQPKQRRESNMDPVQNKIYRSAPKPAIIARMM